MIEALCLMLRVPPNTFGAFLNSYIFERGCRYDRECLGRQGAVDSELRITAG